MDTSTLASLFRPRRSIHFNCLYPTHIFLIRCWGEISEFHYPQTLHWDCCAYKTELEVDSSRGNAALPCGGLSSVNQSWTLSGWFLFTSSSSSLRRISFSVWEGSRWRQCSDTHRQIGTRERICKTIHRTKLTWLANMREHLVLSVGSAVILRINCSIGVIPERVKDAEVSRYCQGKQCDL